MCRGLWVPTSGWTPFGLLTSSRISWYLVIQWCFRQYSPFLQGSWENPLLDYPSGSPHQILLQPSLLSSCSSAPFSPLNFSLSFSHSKPRRKFYEQFFPIFIHILSIPNLLPFGERLGLLLLPQPDAAHISSLTKLFSNFSLTNPFSTARTDLKSWVAQGHAFSLKQHKWLNLWNELICILLQFCIYTKFQGKE